MKGILIGVVFCFSTAAFADFTGTWSGKGTAQSSDGWQATCGTMMVDLVQSSTELKVNSGQFVCSDSQGSLVSNWSPMSLEIRGSELWIDGNRIGSIDSQRIHAELIGNDSMGRFKSVFDVEMVQNGLTYKETVSNLQNGGSLTIQGFLTK